MNFHIFSNLFKLKLVSLWLIIASISLLVSALIFENTVKSLSHTENFYLDLVQSKPSLHASTHLLQIGNVKADSDFHKQLKVYMYTSKALLDNWKKPFTYIEKFQSKIDSNKLLANINPTANKSYEISEIYKTLSSVNIFDLNTNFNSISDFESDVNRALAIESASLIIFRSSSALGQKTQNLITVLKKQAANSKYFLYGSIGLAAALIIMVVSYKNMEILQEKSENHSVSYLNSNARFIEIGEVAVTLAHEIKNPLQSIIAGISAIKYLAKTGGDVSFQKIIKTGEKLEALTYRISNILKDVQKLAYDSSSDDFQDADIIPILDSAINLCQLKAKDAYVDLSFEKTEEQDYFEHIISCRESQIIQVVTNIISNAIDAAKESINKKVTISLEYNDSSLNILIKDSGLGVPLELRSKIFSPFFTTKQNGEGTGIGLHHSKEIMRVHGGDVFFDSSAPLSTFVIKMPCKKIEKESNFNRKRIA